MRSHKGAAGAAVIWPVTAMQLLEFKNKKSQESDYHTGEAAEPEAWKQEESSLSAVNG